jgi:hypothetical protein
MSELNQQLNESRNLCGEQAVMIRNGDKWWLCTVVDGQRKASYLGRLGKNAVVEAWCAARGIPVEHSKPVFKPVARFVFEAGQSRSRAFP